MNNYYEVNKEYHFVEKTFSKFIKEIEVKELKGLLNSPNEIAEFTKSIKQRLGRVRTKLDCPDIMFAGLQTSTVIGKFYRKTYDELQSIMGHLLIQAQLHDVDITVNPHEVLPKKLMLIDPSSTLEIYENLYNDKLALLLYRLDMVVDEIKLAIERKIIERTEDQVIRYVKKWFPYLDESFIDVMVKNGIVDLSCTQALSSVGFPVTVKQQGNSCYILVQLNGYGKIAINLKAPIGEINLVT